MADEDDELAIIEQGEITLAQFPPLEFEFDYVVNDFMPYDRAAISYLFLEVDSDGVGGPIVEGQHAEVLGLDHNAAGGPLVVGSGETSLFLESDAAGTPIAEGTHTYEWVVENSASASNIVAGNQSLDLEIEVEATAYYFTQANQDLTFSIELDQSGDVAVSGLQNASLTITTEASGASAIDGGSDLSLSLSLSTQGSVSITGSSTVTLTVGSSGYARNTAYIVGNILNIPVWPFAPNWASGITETLEWLTDIMTAPNGSEQRRALRPAPRQAIEFALVAQGDERSLLDNFLTSYSARTMYVPIWFDTTVSSGSAIAGSQFIPATNAESSGLKAGSIAFLSLGDPFIYEVAEVDSVDEDGIHTRTPLESTWPHGTMVYPAKTSRLFDQPRLSKRTDAVVTTDARFQVLDPNPVPDFEMPLADTYRGFAVMAHEPDERERLDNEFERMLEEIDNQMSVPQFRDSAGRPFNIQKHNWTLRGRDEHSAFYQTVVALRGRAFPFWLPTYMQDFVLKTAISSGATSLNVDRSGFALTGGPRWDRQDIMIETIDTRFYRRIVDVVVAGDGSEILALDEPIPAAVPLREVVRVCFMALSRFNQDVIEIEHLTDTMGVSTVSAAVRSAPDTRIAMPAF